MAGVVLWLDACAMSGGGESPKESGRGRGLIPFRLRENLALVVLRNPEHMSDDFVAAAEVELVLCRPAVRIT